MSGKMVGAVWELDLPHAEAWVLMALADHAHHDGSNMFASQKLLAWKTGYSERQIRRILESLEEQGLIVPQSGGVGRGMIQSYRLDLTAAKKKEPIPENRSNCPVKEKRKADKLSGEKADVLSTNPEEKEDILTANEKQKADILTDKSGHFEPEKRTFSTGKADIFDTSHDKERARLTVENHENRREPGERAHAREATAPALAKEETLSRIDSLREVAFEIYAMGPIDQRFEARLSEQVGRINAMGGTPQQLQAFLEQKTPNISHLADDFQAWRVRTARNAGPSGQANGLRAVPTSATLVGLATPPGAEERVPDDQLLADADVFEADYPDPAARPGWVTRLLREADQIRARRANGEEII